MIYAWYVFCCVFFLLISEKMQKASVSFRSKNEMEYAIIFIFHEGKRSVAQSTVLLENVIKMETTELNSR